MLPTSSPRSPRSPDQPHLRTDALGLSVSAARPCCLISARTGHLPTEGRQTRSRLDVADAHRQRVVESPINSTPIEPLQRISLPRRFRFRSCLPGGSVARLDSATFAAAAAQDFSSPAATGSGSTSASASRTMTV